MIQEKMSNEAQRVTEFQQLREERKKLEGEIQAHEAEMNGILEPVPTLKSYFQIRGIEESEPPFKTLVWEEHPLTGELVPEGFLLAREFGEAEEFAKPEVERLRAAINGKQFALSGLDDRVKLIRVKAAIEGSTLPGDSSALSVKPQESEMKNPRGAGRPRDPEVGARRQMMFQFLREQEITNKKDAAKSIWRKDHRARLYDVFQENSVAMVESDKYETIRKWSELKKEEHALLDLDMTAYLVKDMRRNWDRLWQG